MSSGAGNESGVAKNILGSAAGTEERGRTVGVGSRTATTGQSRWVMLCRE